jgi:DeoR/GlpR family transcriptional regulator of sugar metabolism
MDTEPLLGPLRQQELLAHVRAHGMTHVSDLASVLGVSASTVRRDLIELEQRGLVERVHGGAAATEFDDPEPIRPLREVTNAAEKRRIGKAAAALVRPYSSILVLGGTSTEAMLPFLDGIEGLTVLTNSISIVNRLVPSIDINVVVLGGVLRRAEMSLLGHITTTGLEEFGVEVVFSPAFGVDPEIGVTGVNLNETQTDRALVLGADRLVILADHTKFDQRGPTKLAPIEAVTTLVTDGPGDEDVLGRFRSAGVDVITC